MIKIKTTTAEKIEELIKRYPALGICRNGLFEAVEAICNGFRNGGKLITCGNGGSAADAAPRQMLHAWKLAIPQPTTGEMLEFQAPPPADMQGLIDALEDRRA